MITFEEALRTVLEKTPRMPVERVSLLQAHGHILAEDITSDVDMPPFDKSAMDGYAVRHADVENVPVTLDIIEEIPAGVMPQKTVGPKQCARIMTGAPVPNGADTVVMQEHADRDGSRVKILEPQTQGINICFKAEDLRSESTVLHSGTSIRPSEIALLAAVGKTSISAYRRPTAAVLATGNEIVEPDTMPRPGQIRNSSSQAVVARLGREGTQADYLGIAGDNPDKLRASLEKGFKDYELFLVTGGVSIGDYDLVKDMLKDLGVRIHFEKAAIKPGKPTVFGTTDTGVVFGLPGNPVSTIVITELFVIPCLRAMAGYSAPPHSWIDATLGGELKSKGKRDSFVPVQLDCENGTWHAAPVEYHGSADLAGFARGNALVHLPAGKTHFAGNETVRTLSL